MKDKKICIEFWCSEMRSGFNFETFQIDLLLVRIPVKPGNCLSESVRNVGIVWFYCSLITWRFLITSAFCWPIFLGLRKVKRLLIFLWMVQIGCKWVPSNSGMLLLLSETPESRKLVPAAPQVFPKYAKVLESWGWVRIFSCSNVGKFTSFWEILDTEKYSIMNIHIPTTRT